MNFNDYNWKKINLSSNNENSSAGLVSNNEVNSACQALKELRNHFLEYGVTNN